MTTKHNTVLELISDKILGDKDAQMQLAKRKQNGIAETDQAWEITYKLSSRSLYTVKSIVLRWQTARNFKQVKCDRNIK